MDKIILEIIPPPITWDSAKVSDWTQRVSDIMHHHEVYGLNLSEVVNESREGERNIPFIPKMDNIDFAARMKDTLAKAVPIPSKISVLIPEEAFGVWVDRIYREGIRHLVIVGGEKDVIQYPGLPVIEAAKYVKTKYPDIKLGGITIFTRAGEHQRIISKMQNGIEFFISQIIFETANLKQVALNLSRNCKELGLRFPSVYVSLSPASRNKDIEFMKWLGVEFPSAVLSYLIDGDDENAEPRTFEVLERVLDEIFYFMKQEQIELGFNIEHVTYTNLELAEKLLIDVKRRLSQ